MSRAIVGWCGVLLAGAVYLELDAARLSGQNPAVPSARTVGSEAPSSNPVRPGAGSERVLLDKYCVTCHNARRKTAGLMLDMIDIDHVGDHAEVWEKVVQKLRTQEMAPPARPRPEPASYQARGRRREAALDLAAAVKRSA